MKATQQKPKEEFIPVILTLETQQEVDAVFALLVHTSIAAAAGISLAWNVLDGMESPEYEIVFNRLNKLLQIKA